MSFLSDLEKWKEWERKFLMTLLWAPKLSRIDLPQGKFKDYDLKLTIDGKEYTFEVKNDLQAHTTGNYVVEYRCNKIASWIFSSKADYIVYIMWDDIYIQSRGELIIRLMDLENKKKISWWDWRRSQMFLLKFDKIEELFVKYDTPKHLYEFLWL